MKGRKSHAIVEHGIKILENLEHRGAVGVGLQILVQAIRGGSHLFTARPCA
ncbi:hypothetical protein ACIKTA_04690 [Hansschlegelia beijingensis]